MMPTYRDPIVAKVASARRRAMTNQFLTSATVTLFVAMLVSLFAIASIAVVPLEEMLASFSSNPSAITPSQWNSAWIIGSVLVAMAAAGIHTYLTAPTSLDVATQVDQRFGLRERLSTALALRTNHKVVNDRQSAISQAVNDDAGSRAEQLDIARKFPISLPRFSWMPLSLFPIVLVMLSVVQPATPNGTIITEADATEIRQVKAAAAELKKRIVAQKKKASEKGLKETQQLFEKMEMKLDKITKSESLNRKDALIQLNELKEQIQQRKDRIGSPDQLRRTLSQMKGLQGGPAEKIAKQIQKGEFANAAKEMKKIAQQIKDGKLSEKQKQDLAKQVKELAKQMKKSAEQHEQKKQELQKKIDQAKREGRSQDAAKMQQQLNQAEAADSQMKHMQQMAQSMQQAADAMQQGDSQAASDAMQQMSDQLGEMAESMEELEDLEDALSDLSQSKSQMNCKQCNGEGCQGCMGNGEGFGPPGQGMGRGAGKGDRPEEETDTNEYDTQVRGDVKRGKAIIAGFADGPNRKGVTREQIKSVIDAAINEESDPLEDQILPRDERDQTRQYFDRLREGI